MNSNSLNGIRVAGTGSYLPGPALDQDCVRTLLRSFPDGLSLAEQEHLLRESGIQNRHYALDGELERDESNTSMAAHAGRRALEAASWDPNDVDLLVVTTVVPDQLMPSTSVFVQEALGIRDCAELEISANCTAPTKGLMFAASQLRVGAYRRALVCSAQLASFAFFPPWARPDAMNERQGHLRWILSDGAGAVALEASESCDIGIRFHLESKGVGRAPGMWMSIGTAHPDLPAGIASGAHHITQPPLNAVKQGLRLATEGLERMLRAFEVPGSTIDHFIPSVSSVQIERHLKRTFAKQGVRPDAWRTNFTRIGYVGSVAVPIMLDELSRSGRLQAGDVVCTVAEESSKWMFAGSLFRWNPD